MTGIMWQVGPRIMWQVGLHRVVWDYTDYSAEDYKGDTYKPECHPDLDPDILRKEEKEYDAKLEHYGVVLLVLQKWNPSIGCGWERADAIVSEYLHRKEVCNEYFPKSNYYPYEKGDDGIFRAVDEVCGIVPGDQRGDA